MSSPFTIPSKTLPQTPASEWSNQTTNALGVTSTTKQKEPTLPGSFPAEPPRPEDSKETAFNAFETAKTYIPAPEEVQKVLADVGEAAAGLIPESVASYFPGKNSSVLPTTSTEAPATTISISKLPEENTVQPYPQPAAETSDK